jgi:hypothetical protein
MAKAFVNTKLDVVHFPGDEVDIVQEGFFEEMKLNSHLIRLHSLQSEHLNNNHPAAACAEYLSATTTLGKFTNTNISSYIPSMAFMYAIGRNGSLHESTAVHKRANFGTHSKKKHVDAFCARKLFLPDLFANARSGLQESLRV